MAILAILFLISYRVGELLFTAQEIKNLLKNERRN